MHRYQFALRAEALQPTEVDLVTLKQPLSCSTLAILETVFAAGRHVSLEDEKSLASRSTRLKLALTGVNAIGMPRCRPSCVHRRTGEMHLKL